MFIRICLARDGFRISGAEFGCWLFVGSGVEVGYWEFVGFGCVGL